MVAVVWAAYYGRVEIVRFLLAAGVDINCQDVVSADLHVIWLMLSAFTPYYICYLLHMCLLICPIICILTA